METKNLLLPFYFGSLTEDQRAAVERDLLTDTEALVDYLDLKRALEAAALPAAAPSDSLWRRLSPKTEARRKVYLSLAIGSAIAAGLAALFVLVSAPRPYDLEQPSASGILFDSNSEHSPSSGVL